MRQVNHALTHAILRPSIIFCSSATPKAFWISAAVPVNCTVRRNADVGSASTLRLNSRAKAFTCLIASDRLRCASETRLGLCARAVRPSAAPVEFQRLLAFHITDTVTMDFAA